MSKTIIFYTIACAIGSQCAVTAWGQTTPPATVPVYTISTVAGNGSPGSTGDGGAAISAELFLPYAAVSAGGNLYISDQVNSRLRIVSNGTINTFAGNGTQGYSGDNGQATKAELFDPTGITVDSTGNVYVSDNRNQVIRKITTGGIISTFAGNQSLGAGLGGDTGSATNAQLFNPASLALDSKGNLYIVDEANAKIRIVYASGASAGFINTFAGNFVEDYAGDGGPAVDAELNNPQGIAIDSLGNVYIADTFNNRIREVTLDGLIHTIAGTGVAGRTGDGGQAINAQFNHPEGIAVDSAGNLYIADTFNQTIRMITTDGVISTIAGTMNRNGYVGDGGPALQAELNFPASVSVDTKGNLYVADSQNNVIRELIPAAPASQAVPTVLSDGGVITWTEFGGFQTGAAAGSWIEIYGNNLAGDTRIWGPSDFSNNIAPKALDGTTVKIAGMPAFVYYVSPGLVNALLPSNVPIGPQTLTVSNSAGTSASVSVNVMATLPGLYSPGLVVGGNQFLAATFSDMNTYVAPPGTIAGVTSARAHPGDTIVFFGIGFGPVTPPVDAGSISSGDTALNTPVQFFFNGTPATATYAGIAPGSVALYQFQVTVPTIPSSDAVEVTFTLGGVPGTQTLYTSVQNTGPQKRPTGLTGPNKSIR